MNSNIIQTIQKRTYCSQKSILLMLSAVFFGVFVFLVSEASACHPQCPPPEPTYFISGIKFNDKDGDGIKDCCCEPGLSGWTINIEGPDSFSDSAVTNYKGNYKFSGLSVGSYTVCEVQQEGWEQTFPTDNDGCHIIEISDHNVCGINFGNRETQIPEPVCGNGIIEGDEECDDGNNDDNDGCSANCTIEEQQCTPGATTTCSTGNLGICAAGTQTCSVEGFWGACVQDNASTTEICDNDLDDDCDGYKDCEDEDCSQDPNCQEPGPECIDSDGDGYYAYSSTTCSMGNDCDDTDANVNPGVEEVCYNQIDDDCDGSIDCEDGDCSQDPICNDCFDLDEDTYYGYNATSCSMGTDCDDTDANVNPGAEEICDNQIDDDCDGDIDDDDSDCQAAAPTGGSSGGGVGGFLPASLVIFNEKNEDVGTISVTVSWFTNIPGTTRVIYDTVPHSTLGTAPNYGYAHSTIEGTDKTTFHKVTISELVKGVTYYWRAISHGSGEVFGNELVFTTKSTYYEEPEGDLSDIEDQIKAISEQIEDLMEQIGGTGAEETPPEPELPPEEPVVEPPMPLPEEEPIQEEEEILPEEIMEATSTGEVEEIDTEKEVVTESALAQAASTFFAFLASIGDVISNLFKGEIYPCLPWWSILILVVYSLIKGLNAWRKGKKESKTWFIWALILIALAVSFYVGFFSCLNTWLFIILGVGTYLIRDSIIKKGKDKDDENDFYGEE